MSDNIVQLNTELIHNELKDLVKNSVEETLNAPLTATDRTGADEPRRLSRKMNLRKTIDSTSL